MTAATWANADPVALARFFDMSLDLLALADSHGWLTRVSGSWEKVLGWTADEMTGRPFAEFLHPGDVAPAAGGFTAIFNGRPSVSFRARCRHRDGSYREIELNGYREAGDAFVYFVARDVTEDRRRERSHRALNEAWLAVSSESSVTDVLGAVNERARALIGARQAVTSLSVGDMTEQAITAVALSDDYAHWRTYEAAPTGSGIYMAVLRSSRPMRLTQAELEAHPRWRGFGDEAPHHPPMRGWLAVPLVGRTDKSLGLIQLSDKEDGSDFDQADEDALVQFARVAALTIERARAETTATEAHAQLEEMLDSISDAFIAFDTEWHITYVNPAARNLVDHDKEPLGALVWDVFPDTPDSRFRREYLRAVSEGVQISFREYHAQLGTWFDVRVFPFRAGLAVYFVDVNDRVAAAHDLERRAAMQAVVAELGQEALSGLDIEALLKETVLRVQDVLKVQGVGVGELVDDGTVYQTRAGASTYPGGNAELITQFRSWPLSAMPTSSVRLAVERGDWVAVNYGETNERPAESVARGVECEISVPIGRPGAVWGVLVAADVVPQRFGVRDGVFLAQVAHVLSSAIERHEAERDVRHRAAHDALTGLPNRQLLRDRMEAALARVTGRGAGAALLLLDLDGFKDVNDSLGHATGDLMLCQVADRLLVIAEGRSTVARLGGDEFAVLVEGVRSDEAGAQLADRIVSAIAVPFSLPELDVPLSTSVGVVLAPEHGTDASTLLRRADVAMYRAKSQSLGWAMYDDEIDAARADRLQTIAELRSGIATGELELHYQPIVDLETGAVASLEALVRWRHPANGLIPPLSFISLAEQTGLIVPLTAWVVDEALRQSQIWYDAGFRARIAVNLSVDVLTRKAAMNPILARFVAAPDRITAEITESSLADGRARDAVARLASAGVGCAVDDFGTGYSSLAYLKELPVSQLKIDRAFVTDVARTARDLAIVRSVADLGAALALDVVAEGVEDEATVAALRQCGVRLAQGYFFARPMAAAALQDWLAGS
ncbi:MAG: hypothetical protein JWM93_3814 [Frankiales bacterium]|nr:hypothetical protein [Frankiales bacterium]